MQILSAYGGDGWQPRLKTTREELGTLWGACGLNSEWAPLRAVLLHRPGAELSASADPGAVNMLAPLDIAVNVALPAITRHFRLELGDVQWLVICYVLVYGSLMLVCGKLGDLFGHRLVFRIGLVISAIGCAACAAAP